MSTTPIPILDLGAYLAGAAGAREEVADRLRHACENVGFYYIRGHGVPRSLVEAVFAEAERFHAQPIEAKEALRAGPDNVGYMPYRGSISRASRIYHGDKPNLNEAFFLKRDLPPTIPTCSRANGSAR